MERGQGESGRESVGKGDEGGRIGARKEWQGERGRERGRED